MVVCEDRPRHPLDRTVRADRRPRHPGRPQRSGTAETAHKTIERYAAEQTGVLLARPDRKDDKARRFGNLAGVRQWIESVNQTWKGSPRSGTTGASTPTSNAP